MTTWNSPYPAQDPNQGYYGGQPGGYPPPPPGHAPGGGYPGAPPPAYGGMPPQGYPAGPGAPYGQPGGAPYGQPGGDPYGQPGGGAPYGQPGGGAYNQSDMYGTSYPEDPEVKGFGFSDKSIRRGFIRKVYSILMLQLLITAGIISFFFFNKSAKEYAQNNLWLFILAFVVVFVTMIALACCGEVRRKAPMNFILLTVFTLAEGFLLAVVTSRYKADSVLMAVGITAALCLGLTLFAFQTKWDFTLCGGFLFIAVLLLMIFGFVISILAMTSALANFKILNLVYASCGALLFSIYLIYDTQLMMGGSHKYSISPEEYIFAALNLYLDIVNIFIYILTIIGAARD